MGINKTRHNGLALAVKGPCFSVPQLIDCFIDCNRRDTAILDSNQFRLRTSRIHGNHIGIIENKVRHKRFRIKRYDEEREKSMRWSRREMEQALFQLSFQLSFKLISLTGKPFLLLPLLAPYPAIDSHTLNSRTRSVAQTARIGLNTAPVPRTGDGRRHATAYRQGSKVSSMSAKENSFPCL
jgi:hypothetical protein